MGAVGQRLGKYEILSELGHGGMSVVYLALDTQLQRRVAVKIMHSFLAEQPEARARLHREAVAVARLRHPNIIEIYDYAGENAEQSYIVTELVEGSSLSERIKKRPLVPPEAAALLSRPIADALAHAHSQGVVHRDLKPENILVGNAGTLKLTDFGIARVLDNQTLTLTGTLLGSPAYMAPEYIEGHPADHRGDLWSFGVMLYQFCVGRLPFEALTPHALLKRIVTGDYMAPEEANPRIHERLGDIIRRCLKRDPNDRYATADMLHRDLQNFLARIEIPETDLPLLLSDFGSYGSTESKLTPRYVALGQQALKNNDVGLATADFNRVLSVDPQHREVRSALKQLTRRKKLRLLARRTTVGLAVFVVFGIMARAGLSFWASSASSVTEVSASLGPELMSFVDENPPAANPDEPTVTPARPQPSGTPGKSPAKSQTQNSAKQKSLDFRIAGGQWVNVYVDGVLVRENATSPVRNLALSYGSHRLKFSNPFSDSEEIVVRVSDTEPPELEPIRLNPKPARLYIEGAPQGARVEVAGKRVGHNPGEPIYVPLETTAPATYWVEVSAGGTLLVRVQRVFKPGAEERLAVHSPSL